MKLELKKTTVRYLLSFISLLGLAIFLAVLIINKTRRKNIIIIDIDVMRGDSITCDNGSNNNTPNICAFANKSVFFKRNIVSSFWTLPSMGSTMTGLYPSASQFWSSKDTLDSSTIASVLKNLGYHTSFVEDSVDYVETYGQEIVKKDFEEITIDFKIYNWIKHIQKLEKREPFFTYIYSAALHDPYTYYNYSENESADESKDGKDFLFNNSDDYSIQLGQYLIKHKYKYFTEKSLEQYSAFSLNTDEEQVKKEIGNYYMNHAVDFGLIKIPRAPADFFNEVILAETNPEATAKIRAQYDKCLHQVDFELKDLLEYLASTSISRDTIVVITSSHGEAFGEHGYYFHGNNIYNEILNTPLIIRANNYEPKIINEISRNIDIFPTITSLLGISTPEDIQGSSLKNLLKNGKEPGTRYAFSETGEGTNEFSIQNKKWKLITDGGINNDKPIVAGLYNLEEDPGEKVNLYNSNLYKANNLLEELNNILNQSITLRARPSIPFPSYIDEEQKKELMKRGYF